MQYATKPSTNGRNRARGHLGPLETITRALRRNWIYAVSIPIVVIVGTAIALRFILPVYEATAQLRIDQQRSNLAVLDALQSLSSGSEIETEMMVLRSRTMAESVVDSLCCAPVLPHRAARSVPNCSSTSMPGATHGPANGPSVRVPRVSR